MKKLLLIINPKAGKQKAKSGLLDMLTVLGREYLVCVRVTEYRGHGIQIAAEAAGYDLVVCVGGDGTMNEVITGVVEAGLRLPIGYIPSGSTNDFAATVGLPSDPVKAAQVILQNHPETFDIGRFDERYFTYVASFGMFTNVSYDTPQNMKNVLGHAAYVMEGIKSLHEIRSEFLRIETDEDVIEGDYIFGAVCNSTSIGGLINLKPSMVDMRDGRFEILLIKMPETLLQLHNCVLALSAQTYNSDLIDFTTSRKVCVYSENRMDWSLDGEKATSDGFAEIHNLQRMVNILTPENNR